MLDINYMKASLNHAVVGMSPFSFEKSFAAQAVCAVSESDHLNPANQGQQSPVCCRKPVRAVARFVAASVGTFFASIIGTIYHSIKTALHLALALGNYAQSKLHHSDCPTNTQCINRAKEHMAKAGLHGRAAAVDAVSLFEDVGTLGIAAVVRGAAAASGSEGCARLSGLYVDFASGLADGDVIFDKLMVRV